MNSLTINMSWPIASIIIVSILSITVIICLVIYFIFLIKIESKSDSKFRSTKGNELDVIGDTRNKDSVSLKMFNGLAITPPFLFISHSGADMEITEKICNILKLNGIRYWCDKERRYSGYNYKGLIVRMIKDSEMLLFLSSKDSNSSINVSNEVSVAIKSSILIIPIKLDNSNYAHSIEYDLSDIDYIEYSPNEKFEEKLIDSIKINIHNVTHQNI